MVKVLHVVVGQEPKVVEVDPNEAYALIGDDQPMPQCIRVDADDLVFIYCDDEGIEKELIPNRVFPSATILGNFFLMRQTIEGDEVDLTENDINRWTKKLALSQSKAP